MTQNYTTLKNKELRVNMEVEEIQESMVDTMNNTIEKNENEQIDSEYENDTYSCVITDGEDDDDEEYDKSVQLPRETMKRIVREISEKVVGQRMRISADAFEIIREAATGQLTEVFRICNRLVEHANRNTIMSQDFNVLFNLIRDLYGPNHPLLKRNDDDHIGVTTRKTLNSTTARNNITALDLDEYEKLVPMRKTTKSRNPKQTKALSKLKIAKKSVNATIKKKTNPRKKVTPVENNNIEMDVETEKCESKKRKLEKLDKTEIESKRAEKQAEEAEAEEAERARKREKREEIKRKSKLVQQESQALIQRINNDPNNDSFHYEFEMLEQT